jgi:ribonuclease BN (tRNA processing enzyme)
MKIKILGCSGGRSIDSDPTCFLIDDRILIDAGAATNKLEDKDLKKLEHLIITHSHFDHIADLPFLMEKLFWIKNKTFTMHCSKESWDAIISHILNNSVWPNLIDIAKTKNEIFQWNRISNLNTINILNYKVTPIRVNHIVATDGLIIDDGNCSIAFTADTYKTDKFWEICNKQTNLKAIIADVSFPNKMDETAEITRHLTPKLFYEETKKLDRDDLRFYISHLKPLFKNEVLKDLAELPIQKSMEILQEGIELTIS